MDKSAKKEVIPHLKAVIAWEMDAQLGIQRPLDQIPALVADTLLDYFDIESKPGVVWHDDPTS